MMPTPGPAVAETDDRVAPPGKAGARVAAVELHPGRVAYLRDRFAPDPVTVVQASAVERALDVGRSLPRRAFLPAPRVDLAVPTIRRIRAGRTGQPA